MSRFRNCAPFPFACKRQAPLEINRVARTRKGSPQEIESGGVNLLFSREAWEGYLVWPMRESADGQADQSAHQRNPARPVSRSWKARAAQARTPSCWSRRINAEHRIVYRERRSLDRATALPLVKFTEPDSPGLAPMQPR